MLSIQSVDMATKKAGKSARKSRSWRDIDQDVKAKSTSSTAFKRAVFSRCRKFGFYAILVLAIAGGSKLFLMTEGVSRALTRAGKSMPIEHIEIESDALSREWVLTYLGLDWEQANLLGIDLKDLRSKLEAEAQVASARIARQLPGTLYISIREREPIARVLAEDAVRGRITLLVDDNGVVYEGIGYDAKRLAALPYLDGIRLKRTEGGFEPIEGMDVVGKLLGETREIAPHIFRTWKVVSLEDFPKLIVKSSFAKEIVFEPVATDYRRQLSELDYIIDYHKSHSYKSIAKVDLTMNSQVPVTHASITR